MRISDWSSDVCSSDLVLHFASPASPKDYLEMPIQTLKVGSLGTHHCLGLAKAKGAQFFIASTSEVYGDPQVHPQTEEYWGQVKDRTSVVSGTSRAVRVDLGGRRYIKTNNKMI